MKCHLKPPRQSTLTRKDGKDPLASVTRVDYTLITHRQRDHAGDAVEFAAELKRLKIPFHEMKPGETLTFRGRQMTRKG